MVEVLCIFVLFISLLFIICCCIVAGMAVTADECDIEVSIEDKKIIDYHKKK